jgi:hypothetical protein
MISSDRPSRRTRSGAPRARRGVSPRVRSGAAGRTAPRSPREQGAPRYSTRQRGQVLVIVAFAMIGLLGMTGVAIDLGFGFAHRRQVANAAEAAAIVGAKALSRHIIYVKTPADLRDELFGVSPVDLYDTSEKIWDDMEAAAAASVKPFTDLGTSSVSLPTWPAGDGNSLQGWYIVPGANAPNGVPGDPITTGAPPANAVGVRVEARLQYTTFFARVLGDCCEHVAVTQTARAVLKPITGNGPGEGGPFIMCGLAGGQVTPTPGATPTGTPVATPTPNMGAWLVGGPSPTPSGPTPGPTRGVQILATTTPGTPVVNYATYTGSIFRVHDEALDNNNASCGAGDSYKGLESPGDSCEPPGVLPCTLDGQPGDRAGPAADLTSDVRGCTNGVYADCAALLPIAANYDGTKKCNNTTCPFEIVTYGCFYLELAGANSHNATLLPTCRWSGETGGSVIDPNAPGPFDFKLVRDCNDPAADACAQ